MGRRFVMPFGMYQGVEIKDIPTEYLEWLRAKDTLYGWLYCAIEWVLISRAKGEEAANLWWDENYPKRIHGKDSYQQRHQQYQPPPRPQVAQRTMAKLLVDTGRRALAQRYHPDMGGNHDDMVAVNTAADWLLAKIESFLK